MVFSPTTGKYGPKKTPHLDTFRAVVVELDSPSLNILARL